MTDPLIVIVGETASGKSDLGLEIAERFGGEIICADSRTIYTGMDIGTAKPTLADQARIRHHMLDVVEPGQSYSAAQFKQSVLELIPQISANEKIPVMVGGSGMYVDSVIFDYQFSDKHAVRDPQNPRHLLKTNQPKDSLKETQQLRPNTLVIGLKLERDVLQERIANRVELMVQNGLVDEVKMLGQKYGWDSEAMSGIGYRFFGQYVRGEIGLDEAKTKFVQGDLSLAKRQRTWFKRNKYIHWIDDSQAAFPLVQTFLNSTEP